ncbi:hypothetical protein BDZ94DRAFT_63802 [Collybia nuda]|uniref:Uncharacterized protein n=1 Tax=Collybia nuda TaxID=64659 RepID=A0A9P6CAZ0_9AGAR|nr:hypothetical protein BDZ94DRAFT_63802 [Collybia nuda]
MATTTTSRNPFRSPAPTPQVTGASSSSLNYAPPPGPPSMAARTTRNGSAAEDPTGLMDEAPPAYTPGPDVYQGEETIEYGPRRPFQSAPPPPGRAPQQPLPQQQQQRTGAHNQAPTPSIAIHTSPMSSSSSHGQTPSLWRQLTGQLAAQLANTSISSPSSAPPPTGSWSTYPGRQEQTYTGSSSRSWSGTGSGSRLPPPPQHPAAANSNSNSSLAPISATAPTSDFARDFYAAGAGAEPESARSAPNSPSGYAPPLGPPPSSSPHRTTTQRHAPPPGPPPGQGQGSGRPTETPTPGHPLLRAGKLLVYPRGYECEKCHNVGYKHADPSHPCKKCWPKYAKPFQGPLVYAYTGGGGDTEFGEGSTTFQRPLPDFRPPQSGLGRSHTTAGSRSAPTSPAHPRVGPQHHSSPPPPPLPHFSPPLPHMGPPPRAVHSLSPYTPPPPGAIVYAAGDPRIGGQPCWGCGGRGNVSFLVFDGMRCEVCSGIGRIF